MSEPKRYAWEVNAENDFDLIEHSEGEYVRYADYARLKAEVERLTKAGDALAGKAISLEYNDYWSEYEKVEDVCIDEVEAWHKAKGVQS